MSEYADWATLVGLLGTTCIISAYAYLTWHDAPNPFVLHGTNLAGAAFLTVSLTVHTNVASLVLEAFWASIAIYGLTKAYLKRKRARSQAEGPADRDAR